MPHSLSPENSCEVLEQDELREKDADARREPPGENGYEISEDEGQVLASGNDIHDTDMTDVQGQVEHANAEIKLEDLFADIDSDDEFPSSSVQEVKAEPEQPLSPV